MHKHTSMLARAHTHTHTHITIRKILKETSHRLYEENTATIVCYCTMLGAQQSWSAHSGEKSLAAAAAAAAGV